MIYEVVVKKVVVATSTIKVEANSAMEAIDIADSLQYDLKVVDDKLPFVQSVSLAKE